MKSELDIHSELVQLIDTLLESKVEFAVCGGLAVAIHGFIRATEDIDILVPEDELKKARDAAARAGFTLSSGRIPFAVGTPEERSLLRVSKIAGTELLVLDLMLVTPVFEPVWKTREQVEWWGRTFDVVSKDGLRSMKQLAGRGKDKIDIEELNRLEDEEGQ